MPRVVEAEAQDAGTSRVEITDDGVVGVDDERRLLGKRRDRLAPALRDELELAVAVELVSEEVAEEDCPGSGARDGLGERSFVHLQEPELGAVRGDERGGDAGEEVGARAVPGEAMRGTQDPGRHRGRGRLPVRRRDECDTLPEPRGERIHRAGVDLPEELPGKRRTAAAARGAGKRAHGAGDSHLESESNAHRRRA